MALSFNGTTINSVVFNGTSVDKVIYNGTTVWTRATPYYVTFTSYPMTDKSTDTNHTWEVSTSSSGYYLKAMKNPDSIAYGNAAGEVSLPTNNCNKVRVKYTTTYSENALNTTTINGTTVYSNVSNQYITFNCSGDTFTLRGNISEATAYWTATLLISEVYFYYE